MCCRFTKLAVFAVVFAGLFSVLSFTKVGSYAKLAWKEARTSVSQAVPIEVEIARLKEDVKNLVPDLNKNITLVANEMAAIEKMEREINVTKTNLSEQKTRLVQMANWIKGGETQFIVNSKVYNKDQIAERMARDYESYKRATSELSYRERELAIKKRALDSAKEQLQAMNDKEQELKLQIAELEAELKAVRVAQTRSQFQIDDSRLSDIKQSLEELRTRVNAERYRVELEGQFANGNDAPASVEKATPRPVQDLAKEIVETLEGTANVANDKK